MEKKNASGVVLGVREDYYERRIALDILEIPQSANCLRKRGGRSNMKIEFVEIFDIPLRNAQHRGLEAERAAWQALLERHCPPRPLTGPVTIQVMLYYHRKGELMDDQVNPRVVSPDLDKLVKAIFDALMAANVILDDAKVCDLHAVKLEYGGPSMVQLKIEDWEEIK